MDWDDVMPALTSARGRERLQESLSRSHQSCDQRLSRGRTESCVQVQHGIGRQAGSQRMKTRGDQEFPRSRKETRVDTGFVRSRSLSLRHGDRRASHPSDRAGAPRRSASVGRSLVTRRSIAQLPRSGVAHNRAVPEGSCRLNRTASVPVRASLSQRRSNADLWAEHVDPRGPGSLLGADDRARPTLKVVLDRASSACWYTRERPSVPLGDVLRQSGRVWGAEVEEGSLKRRSLGLVDRATSAAKLAFDRATSALPFFNDLTAVRGSDVAQGTEVSSRGHEAALPVSRQASGAVANLARDAEEHVGPGELSCIGKGDIGGAVHATLPRYGSLRSGSPLLGVPRTSSVGFAAADLPLRPLVRDRSVAARSDVEEPSTCELQEFQRALYCFKLWQKNVCEMAHHRCLRSSHRPFFQISSSCVGPIECDKIPSALS